MGDQKRTSPRYPSTPNNTKLRIEGVRKRYGAVEALKSTSLEVRPGEFLTLLGPSGSGKTTLLSLIAGLIEPDDGRIVLDGRDIVALAPYQRGLGMVFQNYALFPHMSVEENVAFGLQTRRLPLAEVRQKVRRALSMVRLEALAQRLPKELSGGQQQRVALARALAYEPSLVLMDEPLGALDRNLREEMKTEIARLHRELGTTVIYVTHDQEEALVLSDRICLMNHAQVEQLGTPQDLYFAPQTRFAAEFLGESNLLPCEFRTDGGWSSAVLGQAMPAGDAMPGRSVEGLVMVRPESIDVLELELVPRASPDAMLLHGTLRERTFIGALTRLHVDVQGTMLKVLQRTTATLLSERHAVGNAITLALDKQRCHVIPH